MLDIALGTAEHGFLKLATPETMHCLHAGRKRDVSDAEPKHLFEIEDLDAAVEHLEDHDMALGERRSPAPGVHVVDARDPEGNRLSVETHDVAES